jgi:hypothetical protein
LGKVSSRNAFIIPKRGSSGACGTVSEEKTVEVVVAMWSVMLASLITGAEEARREGISVQLRYIQTAL